jgi:hypothetical protein
MAAFVVPKRAFLSRLPEINVHLDEHLLYLLPFTPNGNELIQEDLRLSISANALSFGRFI